MWTDTSSTQSCPFNRYKSHFWSVTLLRGSAEVAREMLKRKRKQGEKEMGESGSLVQAAGFAAFLSPEMGEQ